jgi:hypothetical protein
MAAPAAVAAAAAAAACSYSGPTDNPIATSLTWFSYAGAGDIRRACAPGAPDRLRFIYNGLYDVQVRTYDVVQRSTGEAMLSTSVRGPADFVSGLSITDPLKPWRGFRGETPLRPPEVAALKRALTEDGFLAAPRVGLQLPSNEFYWLVAGCIDGRFQLNGWLYPSPGFARLTFPALLQRLDPLDVPFYAARGVNERYESYIPPGGMRTPGDTTFILELGRNGLVGID